jgi:hypothetical protein
MQNNAGNLQGFARAIAQFENDMQRPGVRHEVVNRRGAGNPVLPGGNGVGRGNRQVPNNPNPQGNGGGRGNRQVPNNPPPLRNPPRGPRQQQNHDNAARRVFDLPGVVLAPQIGNVHIGTPLDKGWFFEGRFFQEPVFPIVAPRQYIYVTASGPGWYSVNPELERNRFKPLLTLSNWETYVVPYYVTNVINQEMIYVLPRDAVTAVREKVHPNSVTEMNVNAIRNVLLRTVLDYPQVLVEELIEYFVRYKEYTMVTVKNMKENLYFNHRNPYAVLAEYPNNAPAPIEYGEPFRMPSVDCNLDFVYEEDETIVVDGNFLLEPDAEGHLHHVLPEDPHPGVHWYRTACFSLEGPERKFQHYDNSDVNASKALKRLLAKNDNHDERFKWEDMCSILLKDVLPNWSAEASAVCNMDSRLNLDDPFEADDLIALKRATRRVGKYITRTCCRSYLDSILGLDHLTWAYYKIYVNMLETAEPWISRDECAKIPHYKKKIRLAFAKKGEGLDTDKIMVGRLEAHVKNELAKTGKAPRLYVGYEEGCLYGNELPDYIKMALSEPYITSLHGHFFTIYLCTKTLLDDLSILFDRIARGMPKNEHMVIIFSDDSVWAGNNDGIPYAFNCDIAACDASVKASGFAMSLSAIAGFDPEKAIGLVKQCTLPINVYSRSRRNKLSIQRRGENGLVTPIEGSGTVLTTLNNFMVMFLASLVYIQRGIYGDPVQIRRSGILVGLNLEVSDNFQGVPEKLQFLKYSPILCTDGRYHMVRNFGCILRSLGKIDGDLLASQLCVSTAEFNAMPWDKRMDKFVSSIIASYVHEPSSELMEALRTRFNGPNLKIKLESPMLEGTHNSYVVLEDSLCRRYDLSPQDFAYLASKIAHIKLGDVVVDEVLARIYNEDYSL